MKAPAKSSLSRLPNFKFNGVKVGRKRTAKTNSCSAPAGKEKLSQKHVAEKHAPSSLVPAPSCKDVESTQEMPPDVPSHMSDMVNNGNCTINFNINLSGLSSKDLKINTESRDLIMARDCLTIASRALKDQSRHKSHKDQRARKRYHNLNSDLQAQTANTTKLSSELMSCQQELSLQMDEVANLKRSLETSRSETAALRKQLKQEKDRSVEAKSNAVSHITNLENVIRNLQASLEGLKSAQLSAQLVDPWINESVVAVPFSPISDPRPTSERSLRLPTNRVQSSTHTPEGSPTPSDYIRYPVFPSSPLNDPERLPSVAPSLDHVPNSSPPSPPAQRRRIWRKRDFAVVVPTTQKALVNKRKRFGSSSNHDEDIFWYETDEDDTQWSTSSGLEDPIDVDNGFDEIVEDDARPTSRPKPQTNEEAQQLFDSVFSVPKNPTACLDGSRLAFKDGSLVSFSLFPLFVNSLSCSNRRFYQKSIC